MLTDRGDRFGLQHLLEREIRQRDLDLDSEALQILRHLVETGASTLGEQISSRGERSFREERLIREARGKLLQITGQLADRARGKSIDSRMVREVMAGICPLWPFC